MRILSPFLWLICFHLTDLLKKGSQLYCRICHILDLANCYLIVTFNLFLYPRNISGLEVRCKDYQIKVQIWTRKRRILHEKWKWNGKSLSHIQFFATPKYSMVGAKYCLLRPPVVALWCLVMSCLVRSDISFI